ncbi:hypothetical protein CMV_000231 [Castanea mollissima]|uniref:Uncharacterized protein n=1 Tax=Castanea mollissima TaxID=60419 RepID=A0A8J4RX62_9ROSI|nr:hypothetical protein CMV_000231 [Castanea mollissima]
MWPLIFSLSLSNGVGVGGRGAGFYTIVGGLPLLDGGDLTNFFFNPSKYPAFTAQEERFRNGNLTENKLEKWRAALTEAASLSKEWDSPNVASWHQSKFIKEIVKHIMDRHQDAHMNVSIFPPGMDSGSRIIITTEDAQLLNVLEVDDVYGAQGIQVIADKYRQNLQMIEDYKDFILKSHAQAHEKERRLIAEIKSERMKRTSEAQNIDDIEESLDQMFPLSTLTSTMNAIMIGMGDQGCGLGALQGNALDFELEEEIISRNALVGNGAETRMPLCYAYGGFGERINRDDTAKKDSVQGTMHLSIPGISEYGDKQQQEL